VGVTPQRIETRMYPTVVQLETRRAALLEELRVLQRLLRTDRQRRARRPARAFLRRLAAAHG